MNFERIPVNLVTGFLGSGKTTLIARLLQQPGFAGTLVIVNEFGEVGIDHDLLEASSDDTILLANGCLCCTIRGNLVDTLLDVLEQRAEGRLRAFERVVVETSGVADPAPILGFVFGEPRIAARYRLGAVITTCDALAGAVPLDRHPEATSQIALADQLLITKAELAPQAAVEALTARLRGVNATAGIRRSLYGDGLDPALFAASASPRDGAACRREPHGHDHVTDDHTRRFTTMMLEARRALSIAELDDLADAIRRCAGPEMLRLKGLLALADSEGFGVVQVVPHHVHAPTLLPGPAPRPGRIVIIAESAPAPALLTALAAFDINPIAAQPGQAVLVAPPRLEEEQRAKRAGW